MASLQLSRKAREMVISNRPAQLYKNIIREIPRILVIFDIVNLGEKEVRQTIRQHFYKHAHIKDNRIITMLLETGYIDLEDTLLQHKQKAQLMLLLQGRVGTEFNSKALGADATEEEQMQRWLH